MYWDHFDVDLAALAAAGLDESLPLQRTANSTIAPLTLDDAWPRQRKLVAVSLLTIFGAAANLLFILCFQVVDRLKQKSFLHLACIGCADLMAILTVGPALILTQCLPELASEQMCNLVHFSFLASTYSHSLFAMLVGVESFFRLACPRSRFHFLVRCPGYCTTISIASISTICSYLDVFMKFNYDYCSRTTYYGYYRAIYSYTLFIILHFLPFIFGFSGMISGIGCLSLQSTLSIEVRRGWDDYNVTLAAANAGAYLIYAVTWTPHLIVSFFYPESSDRVYYYTAWIGASRAVFTGIYYGVVNKTFRDGYKRVLVYLCYDVTPSHGKRTAVEMYELADIITAPRPLSPRRPGTYDFRDTQSL